MGGGNGNPYLPKQVTIEKIEIENEAKDIKSFQLVFCKEEDEKDFQPLFNQDLLPRALP